MTEDQVPTTLSYAIGVPLSGTEVIYHCVIEMGADRRHNRKMLDKDQIIQPEHAHIRALRVYLRHAGKYPCGEGSYRTGWDPLLELKTRWTPTPAEVRTDDHELMSLLKMVKGHGRLVSPPDMDLGQSEATARKLMETMVANQLDYELVHSTAHTRPPTADTLQGLLSLDSSKNAQEAGRSFHCPISYLAWCRTGTQRLSKADQRVVALQLVWAPTRELCAPTTNLWASSAQVFNVGGN